MKKRNRMRIGKGRTKREREKDWNWYEIKEWRDVLKGKKKILKKSEEEKN